MKRYLFLLCLLCMFSRLSAQSPYVTVTPFLSGLTNPLAMAHCGDQRVFIVQKNGIIKIADAITGALQPTPFLDIDARVGSTGSEQGLLGMAFHPDYKNNGFFFVNYTNNIGNTTISRFSVNPADSNLALPGSEVILHLITQPYSNHNGGNLAFGPDGYLYIGMGDGGSSGDPQNRAQNPNELLGKMLRIDVSHGDSSLVPPSNPFINTAGYRKQIWQTGMRNPWRYSFDRVTGDLWIGDVGQNAMEEIDFQPVSSLGGENWGWRCYEGNAPYNTAGCQSLSTYTPPVYEFSHAGGNCSVSGGYVYRGALYGNLNGHYLFTDYCSPVLRTISGVPADTVYMQHATISGGIVGFGEDVYGELYVFHMSSGIIERITDTVSCAPAVMISNRDTIQLCDTAGVLQTAYYPGLVYDWYKDGVQLNVSDPKLTVNQAGQYVVIVLNPANGCFNSDTVFVETHGPAVQVSWLSPLDSLLCGNFFPNGQYQLSAVPSGGVYYGFGVTDSLLNYNTSNGYRLLEYVYTDSAGCIYRNTIKVDIQICGSVNEQSLNAFHLFPNPSKGEVTLELPSVATAAFNVEVLDAAGRKVYAAEIAGGLKIIQMPLGFLDTGSYYVRLSGENITSVKSLMIVR